MLTTDQKKAPRVSVRPKDAAGTPRLRRTTKNAATFSNINYSSLELRTEIEFAAKYRVCEKIGRGAFTVVHRCYDKKTTKQFAARFIRIGRNMGTKEMVHRELDIMYLCQGQNDRLVNFYEAFDLGSYVVMILEYIPGGELSDRIVRDDPRMTEEDCRDIARQLCEGIAYLHRNSIAHLDLKPENVLCMCSVTNQVKLIDFGLARRLERDSAVRMLFATPEFCAPEVVNYETVSFATDMWSIGVIVFVMLSQTSPFLGDDDDETLTNVSDASWDFQEECWETISIEAKDFLQRLLQKSKELRMTAEESLKHPWIQGRQLVECSSTSKTSQTFNQYPQKDQSVYSSGAQQMAPRVCWTLTTRKK